MSSSEAMLPNPSHLPNEPTEAIESNNDGTLSLKTTELPVPMQHPSIAKQIGDINMGLEGQAEGSDVEERSEFLEDAPSDEDTDMSDGGAALTMTLSHAEQLNVELDMLDAEIMGSDNLVGLHMDNHYQPTMIEGPPIEYYDSVYGPGSFQQSPAPYDESTMDHEVESAPLAIPNLPVAMSAVAQQLQHIQDGQGHALTIMQDALHGVQENSTLPFFYHHQFPTIPSSSFVSMADISPAFNHQPALTIDASHAPDPWLTEGWTPQSDMGITVMSSQAQFSASHFPSSAAAGLDEEQVTNADQDAMDDQFNLSLAEFLYNWAHSFLPDGDMRKSPRGPSLPAVENQREMVNTSPLMRNDLQGERCDIQGINWTDLGVSRSDARKMRRRTYRNYANLRTHLQWHVSTE